MNYVAIIAGVYVTQYTYVIYRPTGSAVMVFGRSPDGGRVLVASSAAGHQAWVQTSDLLTRKDWTPPQPSVGKWTVALWQYANHDGREVVWKARDEGLLKLEEAPSVANFHDAHSGRPMGRDGWKSAVSSTDPDLRIIKLWEVILHERRSEIVAELNRRDRNSPALLGEPERDATKLMLWPLDTQLHSWAFKAA